MLGVSYPMLSRRAGGGTPGPWSPLSDVALVSGLYLPGGYSTTGTPSVDQTGTWTDASGHGRHFVYNDVVIGGGFVAPVAHADGYPIFPSSGGSGLVCVGSSIAGHFAGDDNGAIIVIAQYRGRLELNGGPYQNAATVCGSGASCGLLLANDGARFEGYDGGGYIESYSPSVHAFESTLLAAKWDSLGAYTAIKGATWGAVTPYNATHDRFNAPDVGPDTFIGMGYGSAYKWIGHIKAVAFYPNAASVDAAKLAQWQAWAIAQGLVSAWSPREDAPCTMLLMPGEYDPNAGGAGVGKWIDKSYAGYGNDVTQAGVSITDADGCPAFIGTDYLSIPKGLGTDFASPNDGAIFCVSKQTGPLEADAGAGGPYANRGTVSGSGASPALYQTDAGAKFAGYAELGPALYTEAFAPSGVAAADVPHLHAGGWNATGLYSGCDEDAFSAVAPYDGGGASLEPTTIGSDTYVGRSFSGLFHGTIYAVALYPTKQPDAKLAQWRAWATVEGLI